MDEITVYIIRVAGSKAITVTTDKAIAHFAQSRPGSFLNTVTISEDYLEEVEKEWARLIGDECAS